SQYINAAPDYVTQYETTYSDFYGVSDLSSYGSWYDDPSYGHCWRPRGVAFGWTPYRQGQWVWTPYAGWTWISSEPWGWAPYHYGRWVNASSRWFWVPAGPAVRVSYAPACVAFVGGTPGFSASVTVGGGGVGGFVGWFPLAPREALVPWWGGQSAAQVNVTNVTYVNRTY